LKRMRRNGVVVSSLITLVFVLVSTFLPFAPVAMGVGPALQPPNKPIYVLGETVTVPGYVDFAQGEDSTKATVTLVISGPQPVSCQLPVIPGTYNPYYHAVKCPYANISVTVTGEGSWGYGYGYGTAVKKLTYVIKWTPPVFLDPPPVFKIIPAWDEAFVVPTPLPTATPTPGGPAELPGSTLAFAIPGLPTPIPDPNAAPDLPSFVEVFTVPTLPTPTPQAGVVDLPSTTLAWTIPTPPTPIPDPNAPADLPTTTEVFGIPQVPTPTPIAGIPVLGQTPDVTKVFDVPGGKVPEGITTDGTNFYMLVNGDTWDASDLLLKLDASGNQLSALPVPPSSGAGNTTRAEGITYLGGFLYISNNSVWPPKIMKVDPADGSRKSEFDAPNWNNIRGIANDGTRLWLANEWGNQIFKVSTGGTLLDTVGTGGFFNFNAMAYNGDLFAAQADKVGAWSKDTKQSLGTWTTSILDIRGMVFKDNALYLADVDTLAVYKSQPPVLIDVTKDPTGMAYDGVNFYISVDGTPKDKILVVNPADGSLVASYDAPDDKTGGLAYLGTNLYVLSNANRTIFKLNKDTGAQVASYSGPGWTDLTALASDGADLFIGQKQSRDIYVRTPTVQGTLTDKGQVWDWDSPLDGYQALEYRALTSELVSALLGDIAHFQKSDGNYLGKWATSLGDIRGLAFIGDVLYMVELETQKVYKASIPSGISVTNEPHDMAYDGTNLYIVVDAAPKDKILVVNPADGSLVKSFDGPSDKVDGIAFLGTSLYVSDNTGNQRHVRKVNKDDGSQIEEYIAPFNGWNDVSALASDGTNFFAGRPNDNGMSRNKGTDLTELNWYWGDWNDPRTQTTGLTYNSSTQELFAVDGSKKKVVRLSNTVNYKQAWTLSSAGPDPLKLTDARGLAFIGDVLYIADAATKKVYMGGIPTGLQITNEPQDLAYDGTNLYVVVDALPKDKILVVNPADGALIRSFDAPSDKVDGITYVSSGLDAGVYVTDNALDNNQRHIKQIDSVTGLVLNEFVSPDGCCVDSTGLGSDGTNLLVGRGERRIDHVKTDGTILHTWWGDWNDPRTESSDVAYRSSSQEIFAMDASKKKIVRMDNQAMYKQAWTVTLADVRGMAFVNGELYLADTATKKIYKSSIPSGIQTTKIPQGIAYDGTKFYVVVDALPKDKILVINAADGSLVTSFDAPSSKIDDITYLGTKLWVADNEADLYNQRYLRQLSPTDGVATGVEWMGPAGGHEDITSLTSIGTNLVAGRRNSLEIYVIQPGDGTVLNQYCCGGNMPAGYTGHMGLAYNSTREKLFGAEGSKIVRMSTQGFWEKTNTTTRLDIRGLVFVDGVLYLADADSESVYKAAIPAPVVTVSTDPLDMTSDGTNLYISVDGSPKDRILVVNPADGTVIRDFNAPGDGAEGMTFIGQDLYVSTYEANQYGGWESKIHKVNKVTGEVLDSFLSDVGEVGALAPGSTSGKMIVGPKWAGSPLIVMDLTTLQKEWLWGLPVFGVDALATGSLYAVSQGQLLKIDKDQQNNYVVADQRMLTSGSMVTGMAFVGTTLYLADDSTNRIMASTAPGKSPERTTKGQYSATLKAQLPNKPLVVSDPAQPFELKKIEQVNVTITQPQNGAAFSTPDVTVSGTVNDPSIKQVFLGLELPWFEILKDNVENAAVSNQWVRDPLWHRTDKGKASSPNFSWYYGREPQMDYETGGLNSGALTSWEVGLGEETALDFATWYNTWPGVDADKKKVQVYGALGPVGQEVTQWWTVAQIVDFIWFGMPEPLDKAPGFQWVQVEPAKYNYNGVPQPEFTWVHLNLADFKGQNVKVRFFFDTVVPGPRNGLEGWYVDDIVVAGSGAKGKPVTVGAGGVFTTTATLADGVNTIKVKAINQYTDPPLSDEDIVVVTLDQTPPQLWFGPVQSPTNSPAQSVTVFFNEPNGKMFTLERTTAAGTIVLAVDNNPPSSGQLQKTVSLVEGVNTLTATLEDKSGLISTAQTVILLDTDPPVLTVLDTVYPVGKVSARAGTATQKGDPVIIQMNAADPAAGVKEVALIMPGNPPVVVPALWAGPANQAPQGMDSVPEAIRNSWGATGQYVLPFRVPQGAPPGGYTLGIRATDWAGNTFNGTVNVQIAAVLSAFNSYLMPKWNLMSLPLIPDSALYAADQNNSQIKKLTAGVNGLRKVWYYNAAEADPTKRWKIFEPALAPELSNLDVMETGKGYWVYMDPSVYHMSPPLGPGLPQTPDPMRLSYNGQFLEPATVPPSYPQAEGWNLLGFHSEWPRDASKYLGGLTYTGGIGRIWASLLRYDNLISFDFESDAPPQIVLGGFASLDEATKMEPGQGFWVFVTAAGKSVTP